MHCPICQEKMQFIPMDNEVLIHCNNCGWSFFEENEINKLTYKSALLLSKDKQKNLEMVPKFFCPRDQNPVIKAYDEVAPPRVNLFRCIKCRGILISAKDLLNYKKAQKAKNEYVRLWNAFYPVTKNIMALLFIAVLSLSAISSLIYLKNQRQTSTQAEEIITFINITKNQDYLFIYFKTLSPFKSKIIFEDRTLDMTLEKNINSNLSTTHQLLIKEFNLKDEIYYQIVLNDGKGNEIRTELKKLEIK